MASYKGIATEIRLSLHACAKSLTSPLFMLSSRERFYITKIGSRRYFYLTMSLHREDRELQIRLAELQAYIQLCATASFGLFTGLLAVIIAASVHAEKIFAGKTSLALFSLVIVACVVGPIILLAEAFSAREQMKELRAKYVW